MALRAGGAASGGRRGRAGVRSARRVTTPLRAKLERLRRAPSAVAPPPADTSPATSPCDPPADGDDTERQSGGAQARPASAAEPDAPTGPAALEKLEATLLGGTGEGLSLRERLERLVSVAGRRRLEPPRPRAAPLEELVQGQRRQNERGEFFLIETGVPLESFHGQVPLTRFRTLAADSVMVMAGEPDLDGFDLPAAAFLDTETTGLAGGTGTAAFLIGLGFVDGDRFRVRQYFMRDYHEEAALLHGLAQDLARFRHLVTFNGKMFDVPLLEARYRLNRAPFPLQGVPHLDLLHPARRLWKARLESCRLQSLEVALLGLRRHDDVPGEVISQLYFDYVRWCDARALLKVFQHNTTDVVSLAALSVLACQWVEGELAEHPLDVFSLGRVLERAARHEQSEQSFRRALDSGSARVRVPALLKLGARAKREGRFDEAVELWEQAAQAGDWFALRELAVHHEHRARDVARALAVVERALDALASGDAHARRVRFDFERRRERLLRKLGGGDRARPA